MISASGIEEFVEHGDDATCALGVGEDGSGVFVGDKDFLDTHPFEVCGVIAVEEFDAGEDGGVLFFDEHGGEDGACVAVLVGAFADLIGEDDGFVGALDSGAFEDLKACKVAFDHVESGGEDLGFVKEIFGFAFAKFGDQDDTFVPIFFAILECSDQEVCGAAPAADDDVVFEFFEIHISSLHLGFEAVDHDGRDDTCDGSKSDDARSDDDKGDQATAKGFGGFSREGFSADEGKQAPPDGVLESLDFGIVGFGEVKGDSTRDDKGDDDEDQPELLSQTESEP